MPEEVDRKLPDAIGDVLFVSDPTGMVNLENEGIPAARCFFVSNVMIDTLLAAKVEAMKSPILETLGSSVKRAARVPRFDSGTAGQRNASSKRSRKSSS